MLRAGLALLIALPAAGCAIDGQPDQAEIGSGAQEIVNGTMTSDFPTTGMLIVGGTDSGHIQCSLTLIGCDTVLTAAHCVCEGFGGDCAGVDPSAYHVFFPNAGFFQVSSIEVNPTYNESIEHDAAVLRLAEPVTGIRPVAIASSSVASGSPATIVGYGRVGGDVYEYGLKREGAVTTTACSPELGANKLCWLYDGSAGSSESNVCHGDSGGSTYVMNGSGEYEVVGVHSTTNQDSCLASPGTYESADTGVFDHRDFIADMAAGSLSQAVCGDLPQIGQDGATVIAESGRVNASEFARHTVEVPRGVAELRIAMNSSDGAGANLDLWVKQGEEANPSWYDCKADGGGAHGICVIPSPRSGTWHVAMRDATDIGGEYQLTTTMLGGAPIATDDTYSTGSGEDLVIDAAAGLLANDEPTARGPLTAFVEMPPAHGTLTVADDGSFSYQPTGDYSGPDSFIYRATDGSYEGAALVTLTVGSGDGSGVSAGCSTSGGSSSWLALLFAALLLRRRRRS
jgi:uncharacterized protein (TIGR03382 family)